MAVLIVVVILLHDDLEPHSRFLEETSQAAADQQEELLEEEDPDDLLQTGLGLTPQVQDGGTQKGDTESEAKENAPVGESLRPVELKQRPEPIVHQRHGVFVYSQKNKQTYKQKDTDVTLDGGPWQVDFLSFDSQPQGFFSLVNVQGC